MQIAKSNEERQAILQVEISKYIRRGYRVVSQTVTTAQLVKPKSFSFFWALVWLLLAVLPFFIYLIYYAAKRDSTIYIEVGGDGQIVRRFG